MATLTKGFKVDDTISYRGSYCLVYMVGKEHLVAKSINHRSKFYIWDLEHVEPIDREEYYEKLFPFNDDLSVDNIKDLTNIIEFWRYTYSTGDFLEEGSEILEFVEALINWVRLAEEFYQTPASNYVEFLSLPEKKKVVDTICNLFDKKGIKNIVDLDKYFLEERKKIEGND